MSWPPGDGLRGLRTVSGVPRRITGGWDTTDICMSKFSSVSCQPDLYHHPNRVSRIHVGSVPHSIASPFAAPAVDSPNKTLARAHVVGIVVGCTVCPGQDLWSCLGSRVSGAAGGFRQLSPLGQLTKLTSGAWHALEVLTLTTEEQARRPNIN